MINESKWTLPEATVATLALFCVLLLNNALPFLTVPTLGQAIWTTGFSQSFTNGPWFTIYAEDFGIPKPAAIAFGLAGAWPASIMIRLGLQPAEAYTTMAALWLSVAFFSAFLIAREFKCRRYIALMSAVAWMSMPIVWKHDGYSMLSLGIALLPFYFSSTLKLISLADASRKAAISTVAICFCAAIVSVFMDGYTFVMFAIGASVLLAYTGMRQLPTRGVWPGCVLLLHPVSCGVAYVLYTSYVGETSVHVESLNFFRGWGLDLSFMVFPARGVLWWADLLGLSVPRDSTRYFGDRSVWETTFSLPIVVVGLCAWLKIRKADALVSGVLLVALLGSYLALGPSLKIESIKPTSFQAEHPNEQRMPSELSIIPTGTAWISETLPGFNAMRASYRWSALGLFAFWLLIVIYAGHQDSKSNPVTLCGLLVLVLLNLPNAYERVEEGLNNRKMFRQIDQDLVPDLSKRIQKGSRVMFIPWGNDFFANYLAPRAGFRTLNIGGDKNLEVAQRVWTSNVLSLKDPLGIEDAPRALELLLEGAVDALVVPYFNMLWSAHVWPCVNNATVTLSVKQVDDFSHVAGFICPAERKLELAAFIGAFQREYYLEVVDGSLFASVQVRHEFKDATARKKIVKSKLASLTYPIDIAVGVDNLNYLLKNGWHETEAHHVWSKADAALQLPVPRGCASYACSVRLKFSVFGARADRPVTVTFSASSVSSVRVISDAASHEVILPLESVEPKGTVSISTANATSPKALMGSMDARVLGVGLQRIELLEDRPEGI